MYFVEAWNCKVEDIKDTGARIQNVEIEISFFDGTATMGFPEYFRDKRFAEETVKHAWETYCRGDNALLSSISRITIQNAQSISDRQAKKIA